MPDKAKPDDPAQSQRFIDMAREVEAADQEGKFEENFHTVITHKKDTMEKTGPQQNK